MAHLLQLGKWHWIIPFFILNVLPIKCGMCVLFLWEAFCFEHHYFHISQLAQRHSFVQMYFWLVSLLYPQKPQLNTECFRQLFNTMVSPRTLRS